MSSLTSTINDQLPDAQNHRVLSATEKRATYIQARKTVSAVLEGESDVIARMATLTGILAHHFPYFFWTGFYRLDPAKGDELVVGPYQGTLGCLRIQFNRGVCGACARSQKPIIVPNVQKFPGHIACDSRSQSEIVIPIFDQQKNLIAVLDVDSEFTEAFDEIDREELVAITNDIFST